MTSLAHLLQWWLGLGSPDNIKRILFGLVLRGLLQLSYDKIIKRAVFSLSHHLLEDGSLSFAIYDDTLWEGMELK